MAFTPSFEKSEAAPEFSAFAPFMQKYSEALGARVCGSKSRWNPYTKSAAVQAVSNLLTSVHQMSLRSLKR